MHQLTLQIFSEIKQNYFKETKENIYYTLATLDIAGHESYTVFKHGFRMMRYLQMLIFLRETPLDPYARNSWVR